MKLTRNVMYLLTQQAKPENGSGTPGFYYKTTSVCWLICAAIGTPTRLRI